MIGYSLYGSDAGCNKKENRMASETLGPIFLHRATVTKFEEYRESENAFALEPLRP